MVVGPMVVAWRDGLHSVFQTVVLLTVTLNKSSKIRELDGGQIGFVLSVEGIVTLELAFSATLDAVPSPPYKACYHSLSQLKDA